MPTFTPPTASCHVLTFKEGLLSAVAHDLRLGCTRFAVTLDPDAGPRAIAATFDADSLVVETVMRNGQPAPGVLSQRDFDKIAATVRDDVLEVRRHARIALTAPWPPAADVAAGRARVEAQVELHGTRRAVPLDVALEGLQWVARARLHQPDFGIRPYSAMFGALKVKPDVDIVVTIPASALGL
jgi:hypothetical protein